MSSDWSDFDRWNEQIAAVVYPETDAPVPVYLDIEGERLAELARFAGTDESKVEHVLADVVARTSALGSKHAFRSHRSRLQRWGLDNRGTTAPPVLPLLAVFSLAAERMAHGDGMSAANYYGRLAELLGAERDDMRSSYQRVAEPFWGSLNTWLDASDGRRGLPTATSIGFRYIGLSISQALVREADRQALRRFFSDFDLAPGADVPPSDLEPLLDSWITRSPSPASQHLRSLWTKASLQERIAEVAATELAGWTGDAGQSADGPSRSRISLQISVRSFPRRRLSVGAVLRLPDPETCRTVTLQTSDGPLPVEVVPADRGSMMFASADVVDGQGLLEGTLVIDDPVGGRCQRTPKRVVVLRKDEFGGSTWVEVRQVLMGDDVAVLATESARTTLETLLQEVARPGWTADSTTTGIPAGWVLYRDVEIFSRPVQPLGGMNELSALDPLTTSQLKLAGGLPLPSPSRNRWHSSRPPEIRAISDGGAFVIRLIDRGDVTSEDHVEGTVLGEWVGADGALVVDLADHELADGNYTVEMCDSGNGATRARKEFQLRSAASVDGGTSVTPVLHALDGPLAAVCADTGTEGGVRVRGVPIVDLPEAPRALPASVPPRLPWWRPASGAAAGPPVARLARMEPGSCFFSGVHHEVLDPALYDKNGKPTTTSVVGRCKFCGTERRYSSSYWRNKRKHERRQQLHTAAMSHRPALQGLSPVAASVDEASWDVAVDALRHLDGGGAALLRRVATHIDPSALFLHQFIGALEALGHIEVRRAAAGLELLEWETAPTAIVDVGPARQLTGYWNEDLMEDLKADLGFIGRRLWSEPCGQGPRRWLTDATDDEILQHVSVEGVTVPGRAGLQIAQLLPPLSEVLSALPRRRHTEALGVEQFLPASDAWQETSTEVAGSYRTGRYSRSYYFRSPEDVSAGTAVRVDVYLAKHAAASLVGRPLMSYDVREHELVTPLGGDLPAMYQRAVVLDSGCLPEARRGHLVYRDVSPDVAAIVYHLLRS